MPCIVVGVVGTAGMACVFALDPPTSRSFCHLAHTAFVLYGLVKSQGLQAMWAMATCFHVHMQDLGFVTRAPTARGSARTCHAVEPLTHPTECVSGTLCWTSGTIEAGAEIWRDKRRRRVRCISHKLRYCALQTHYKTPEDVTNNDANQKAACVAIPCPPPQNKMQCAQNPSV